MSNLLIEYIKYVIGKEQLEETTVMINIEKKEVEFFTILVIQFAFIVLFSPYFIPVGFLAYFMNLGVIALTITFYGFITKRSIGRKCSNIGIWNRIFLYLSYLGVLYNTVVILVPGNNLIGLLDSSDSEREAIIAFLLENAILFLKFIIQEIIPNVPHWVNLRLKKERKSKKIYNEKLRSTIEIVANKGEEDLLLAKEEKNLKNVYDNGYQVAPVYVSRNMKKNGDSVPLLKVE